MKNQYIREKNHYRNGGTGTFYFKVSSDLIDDEKYIENRINYVGILELKKLSKKYKMSFEIIEKHIVLLHEDFEKNIQTVLFTFKAIK